MFVTLAGSLWVEPLVGTIFDLRLRSDAWASIAIAGVVLLSSSLVAPSAPALVSGFLVLALLWAAGRWPWRRALALAWRIKWFYLSLLVFFGWWHAHAPPRSGWQRWLPSPEGLGEAGIRIAALLLLVFWVAWLTTAFDREALTRGLTRWLVLLRPLGLQGERFSRRLFLALECFENQRAAYRGFRAHLDGSRWSRLRAGREFMVVGLERALRGEMPLRAGSDAGRVPEAADRGRSSGLGWEVALLWLAVFLAFLLRVFGGGV